MIKCPYCGKELNEGEVCSCRTDKTMVNNTTETQITDNSEFNDTQKTENVNEKSKEREVQQTDNVKEKVNRTDIASALNNLVNIAVKYCYLTLKFSWSFLKNPFTFISKVIENNDYKAGILFAIIAFLIISVQNLVLTAKGIKLVEDVIGLSGIFPSYASFRTFLYNFVVMFILYLLYCTIIKITFTIIKESVEFKAIVGTIGVSLIPIAWVAVLNLVLQFITVWLVILLSMFSVIINTVLNFWSIKTLAKDKNTTALYITATAYIVCIIIVAIIMFAMANSITGSAGSDTIGFSSKSDIIGTWSDDKDTIIFYPNGTFKAHYYWIGGAWEIDGNKLYLTGTLTGKEGYYYKVEGNRLILEPIPGSGMGKYEFYRVK